MTLESFNTLISFMCISDLNRTLKNKILIQISSDIWTKTELSNFPTRFGGFHHPLIPSYTGKYI